MLVKMSPVRISTNLRRRFSYQLVAWLRRHTGSSLLRAAEIVKRPVAVRRVLYGYDPHIRQAAKDDFQQRLMRAIALEEELREFPPFVKSALEGIGFGDSLGPAQIRVSLWAEKYGTSRQELLAAKTHFETMRRHLDKLELDVKARGMRLTIANVASLWNDGDTTKPTDYGLRVKDLDRQIRARFRKDRKAVPSLCFE